MENKQKQTIKLNQSKAFSIWSSPDKWAQNTISATSTRAPEPEPQPQPQEKPAASPAPATLVATPEEQPAAESVSAQETVNAGGDADDTWKWAFILTLIAALGIIASQQAAIGEAGDENRREIASRVEVSKMLAAETQNNADLTDEITAKSAIAETLANERVDLQAAMKKEAMMLGGTIENLKKEIASKASQVEGMESNATAARAQNEIANKKITALSGEIEKKGEAMKEVSTALATASAHAAELEAELNSQSAAAGKLQAQAKELEAKLKFSTKDKQALDRELTVSSEALTASHATVSALEVQIADLNAQIAELAKSAVPSPAAE